jgi:hypothetical protein
MSIGSGEQKAADYAQIPQILRPTDSLGRNLSKI